MNDGLKLKIDELVKLSDDYRSQQAKKYPDGISFFDADVKSILSEGESSVVDILKNMPVDELVYVMAFMWYGRGDGIGDKNATFDYFLENASEDFKEKDFDMNVSYIAAKPLWDYLPKGIERFKNES